jgi:hypothetical protein
VQKVEEKIRRSEKSDRKNGLHIGSGLEKVVRIYIADTLDAKIFFLSAWSG